MKTVKIVGNFPLHLKTGMLVTVYPAGSKRFSGVVCAVERRILSVFDQTGNRIYRMNFDRIDSVTIIDTVNYRIKEDIAEMRVL